MADKYIKKLTVVCESITGRRYCSSCAQTQNSEGGKWVLMNGGLKRRWKCGGCIQRATKRAGKAAA